MTGALERHWWRQRALLNAERRHAEAFLKYPDHVSRAVCDVKSFHS